MKNTNTNILPTLVLIVTLLFSTGCDTTKLTPNQNSSERKIANMKSKKFTIQIILGSTRQGRTSDKIGNALKQIADKRTDIVTEIIDLRDYNIPFLDDKISPAVRQIIIDPAIEKWSEKIDSADAFIIVTPEYNAGYPGVLKNAMDSLYREWNNKPVAFVGYSGGPTGGSSATAQLKQVALGFKMKPISTSMNLPNSWKLFDENGNLTNPNIEKEFNNIIDQISAQ